MSDLASNPRILLRRLHQLMAGGGSPQDRLNQLVRVIAQNMVAEVCSLYVARAGNVLELFATEGLKSEAVHKTFFRFGEGLVGLVAESGRPLATSEAPDHPDFAYRPDIGEDLYHAFLGVPIIQARRVRGVLVVQNVASRDYTAEEVEVLQTVAMVLSELIAGNELVDPEEITGGRADQGQSQTLVGRKLADGVAIGIAFFHEPRVEVRNFIGVDLDRETDRLHEAVAQLRRWIDAALETPDLSAKGEHREVFEAYRMFAYDDGWTKRMIAAINSGLTAEAGAQRVQQQTRQQMGATTDPYLRERLQDLDDLANRLIRILVLGKVAAMPDDLPDNAVLIARDLGPGELLDYNRARVCAIILEEGSVTTHATIVARAMGVPMIGRVINARGQIDPGTMLIVDADSSQVFVNPSEDLLTQFGETIRTREAIAAEYEAERDLPAITRDGRPISLMINAGLVGDMPQIAAKGAEGVGLFRTEFQFMVASALPKLADQVAHYREIFDAAEGKPVTFRTLDIGGDKPVAFIPMEDEENPALGWRAIRLTLDRPALLRMQIRALVEAANGRALSIMFPMIATIAEFRGARAIVEKELGRLDRLGLARPARLEVGSMLEVPALAEQLDALFKEADFLSIGTNDLMQFFFAVDRSNPKLSERYDLLSPPFLRFLHRVIEAGRRAGRPVTICGEMGNRPLDAFVLVALGLDRLSISPAAVGPIKRMIRNIDQSQAYEAIMALLKLTEPSIREHVRHYALDHGVSV